MRPRYDELDRYRVAVGPMVSPRGAPYGAFMVPGPCGRLLTVIATDGAGHEHLDPRGVRWEHVSVSTPKHTPNWSEMSFIKDLFWADDEAVMQLHPPRASYVNNHAYCLHLWRPVGVELPLPPVVFVGDVGRGTIIE